MPDGWSQEFDIQIIPEEVMNSIRNSIKMWDVALQKRNEEILQTKQEEVKRLDAEHKKLMGDGQTSNVPEPKYRKWYFCPCMNGGDGGFIIDE